VTSRRINIGVSPFAKLRVKFSIIDIPLKRAILFGRRGKLKLTYATRVTGTNTIQGSKYEVKGLIAVRAKLFAKSEGKYSLVRLILQ